MNTAKKKPIKGKVSLNTEEGLVKVHPIRAPGKLQRSLYSFFRPLPQLKKARVVITHDGAVVEPLDEAEELSAERAQAAGALKRQKEQLSAQLERLEAPRISPRAILALSNTARSQDFVRGQDRPGVGAAGASGA